MSGVSASFDNEIDRTVDSFDADGWVVRADSFGPFTGPATMPSARAAAVRELPGVRRADPVAVLRATTDTPERANVNLIGVVPGGVGSPPGSGRVLRGGGAAIADESLGLAVGDRLDLNGADFRVGAVTSGMTYFAGIPTVTVSLRDAQATRPRRPGPRDGGPHARPSHRRAAGLAVLGNGEVKEDLGRPVQPG